MAGLKDGLRDGNYKVTNLDVSGQITGGGWLLGKTKIWYVNAGKTSTLTGDGTTWDEAFLTITEAVDAAAGYDTILLAGTVNQDSDSDPVNDYAESVTIPATKMGLRIIGCGNGPEGVKWTVGTAEGTILTINAIDCYIANIRFRPNGATTGKAIFLAKSASLDANASGTLIENCIFRSTTETALSGIHTEGANDVTVRNCKFTSVATAINQLTGPNSITYRMRIENNQVDDKCTNGFMVDCRSCVIKDNDIATVGLTVIISTIWPGGSGQENIVTGHIFLVATDYETNCKGTTTDNWWGNLCDDTGSSYVGDNTDAGAQYGQVIDYPH